MPRIKRQSMLASPSLGGFMMMPKTAATTGAPAKTSDMTCDAAEAACLGVEPGGMLLLSAKSTVSAPMAPATPAINDHLMPSDANSKPDPLIAIMATGANTATRKYATPTNRN